MKLWIFFVIVTLACAIPAGTVIPCGAPKPSDSTALICQSTLPMLPLSTDLNNASALIVTARSYCALPANAPDMVAAYNAAPTSAPFWFYNHQSSQNTIVQLCYFNTSGNIFDTSCRYVSQTSSQVDYALPGFATYVQNSPVVYNNSQPVPNVSYKVQNTSGLFTDYCNLQTDTTLPTSHQMPAGCVTIYSSVAAYNICQAGFMENMPACDNFLKTASSVKYNTAAIPNINFCYSTNGVVPFTPVVCATTTANTVNGVYVEGCGTFAAGQAESSHPSKTAVYLVSPADRLYSLFDVLFNKD